VHHALTITRSALLPAAGMCCIMRGGVLVDATQKFALQHASPLTWRAHAQAQQPEVAAACPSPSIALMTCIGQCVMRVMMQSTAMCTIACTTRAISQSPENRAAAGTWCHRTGRMCLGVRRRPTHHRAGAVRRWEMRLMFLHHSTAQYTDRAGTASEAK
jgi:hypothetical protein